MIAQRTFTTANAAQYSEAAVQEAMRLLSTSTAVQCWACDVCGMLHTATMPEHCDSCGATISPAQRFEPARELNSRGEGESSCFTRKRVESLVYPHPLAGNRPLRFLRSLYSLHPLPHRLV